MDELINNNTSPGVAPNNAAVNPAPATLIDAPILSTQIVAPSTVDAVPSVLLPQVVVSPSVDAGVPAAPTSAEMPPDVTTPTAPIFLDGSGAAKKKKLFKLLLIIIVVVALGYFLNKKNTEYNSLQKTNSAQASQIKKLQSTISSKSNCEVCPTTAPATCPAPVICPVATTSAPAKKTTTTTTQTTVIAPPPPPSN